MKPKRALMMGLMVVVLGLSVAVGEPVTPDVNLVPHATIQIHDDASFTAENGVVSGTGTEEDPYLIKGWAIDATDANFGISIEGTTKAFRIENCHVFGAKAAAIRLVDPSSMRVTNSLIEDSITGIFLVGAERAVISGNRFKQNSQASILVSKSSMSEFYNNRFISGGTGIMLHIRTTNNRIYDNVFDHIRVGVWITSGSAGNRIYRNDFLSSRATSDDFNRWDDGRGQGNHWSRYRGNDRDNDGIGDTPQRIFGTAYELDHHPHMTPFHPAEE